MRRRREGVQARRDGFAIAVAEHGRKDAGRGVLPVDRGVQPGLAEIILLDPSVQAEADQGAVDPGRTALTRAETVHSHPGRNPGRVDHRVIGTEHRRVARLLVGEQPHLGRGVSGQ